MYSSTAVCLVQRSKVFARRSYSLLKTNAISGNATRSIASKAVGGFTTNACSVFVHSSQPFQKNTRKYSSTTTTDVEEDEDDSQALLEEQEEEQILADLDNEKLPSLHPSQIVKELDRFIIGQTDAKKAVALALRNRWRRHQLPDTLKDEVIPKNMLLVGPTGVGKTEIARRIAKLQKAPFIKVEATKYTEVGYHGKDTDTIISDLVDIAIHQTKSQLAERIKDKLKKKVDDVILKHLTGLKDAPNFRALLETGALEKSIIEYQPKPKSSSPLNNIFTMDTAHKGMAQQARQASFLPIEFVTATIRPPPGKKKITVAEYRKIVETEEIDKLLTHEIIRKRAMKAVEQDGIVFIDEIDKVCVSPDQIHRPSASDEGVQKDLLPLIEGTTVSTKYGNIDTSKILFICGGAFHSVKPSDLLPELQGRLPIRVQLKALTRDDLFMILTQTENNLIKQQTELLKTEGINLVWTDDAVHEIAQIAADVNQTVENIGARRLHTVIEKLIEEPSFFSEKYANGQFVIDKEYVRKVLGDLLQKADLSRFIL